MCICGSLCPEFLRPGCSPSVATRVAALAETMRIFQRQHVGQRDQRAHSLDLLQQRRLRIALLRDGFDLLVVLGNALAQRFQRLAAAAPARLVVPGSGPELSRYP